MINQVSFSVPSFIHGTIQHDPKTFHSHVRDRVSFLIKVYRDRLTSAKAYVIKVFLEACSKGSPSLTNVKFGTLGTREDIDKIVCLACEMSVDVHGCFGPSHRGGRTNERACPAFGLIAWCRARLCVCCCFAKFGADQEVAEVAISFESKERRRMKNAGNLWMRLEHFPVGKQNLFDTNNRWMIRKSNDGPVICIRFFSGFKSVRTFDVLYTSPSFINDLSRIISPEKESFHFFRFQNEVRVIRTEPAQAEELGEWDTVFGVWIV